MQHKKAISLLNNVIHLWKINLEDTASLENKYQLLSLDEKERANRFKFAIHSQRFINARSGLRQILSKYLNLPANQIKFVYSEHGKPKLDEVHNSELDFNISHSENLALCAITINRPIGVDIEFMKEQIDYEGIAQRFFSTNEVAMLANFPEHDKKAAFFRGWARKEAFIKAIGEGLSFPLRQFDVSLLPSDESSLLAINGNHGTVQEWNLLDQAIHPDYAAAVAIKGKLDAIQQYELTEK